MILKHSLHNNLVNQAINTSFFPDLPDFGDDEEDNIYFTMESFDILDDVVSPDALAKIERNDLDQVGKLYSTAIENELGGDGWSDVLSPIISMPQRSKFKQIFIEIDRCVNEFISQCS